MDDIFLSLDINFRDDSEMKSRDLCLVTMMV